MIMDFKRIVGVLMSKKIKENLISNQETIKISTEDLVYFKQCTAGYLINKFKKYLKICEPSLENLFYATFVANNESADKSLQIIGINKKNLTFVVAPKQRILLYEKTQNIVS